MAASLARSLSRGVAGLDIAACFCRIYLILDFHMLVGPFWKKSIQAPAIQLAEHAQAILADDREIGLTRRDPVVEAIARGGAHGHAAPWLHKKPIVTFISMELGMVAVVFFFATWP